MVQIGNNKTLKTFSNKLHTELLGCDFKKTSSVKSMSIKSKTREKTKSEIETINTNLFIGLIINIRSRLTDRR
jgi:hypothetical protein